MGLFDYKKLALPTPLQESEAETEVYLSKYLAAHYQKVSSLEKDLMRIPTSEEFFFLQSDTAFNAFTFIPLVAKVFPIKELHASTYSLSRKVIDALIEMHDKGQIERITLLVSDSMIKRNPLTIDVLEGVAKHNANFNVKYYWNHSKVCLIKAGDFHLGLEGSGNWSENAQLEQYTLFNHPEIYNFRKTIYPFFFGQ